MSKKVATAAETQITGWAAKSRSAPLEQWTYTAPALGDDDVHIDISHCGVCHSDVHTLDEGWGPTQFPVIVGHEIVGTIGAVGPHVKHLKVGDKVGVGAQCASCQQCIMCHKGRDNLCNHGVFTYNSTHPSGRVAYGGYAEAVRVPASYAFKLPENLAPEHAAPLLCAGVTVYSPLKRAITAGSRVGIVGLGGLGHLAVQFARALGAREVVALSTSSKKAADTEKLGATKFVLLDSPAAFRPHAGSLDVILCTASHHALPWEAYLSLLAAEGKFIVVGLPEEPIKLNLAALIMGQKTLTGSLIGSRYEVEEMLEFAAKYGVKPWIEKVPMSQVNTAIARLKANDVRYRFVLEN